ncbi:uncharacterized protein [Miscanthus floridulus]|uniref:uncharacterized protein n=1 Tax=Miscanthus floridulus TaxID=154761 RepID=UPI0034581ED9
MDGGSGLNIMYAKTLDEIGIDRSNLHPIRAPFHSVVPGKHALPLGQIDLPVTFENQFNYRTEILTFDVVGFPKTFHAILGHPCYAKFMAVPNYTYLKLKMLGPRGVITIGTSFQRAYECEVECCGHAAAIIASRELTTLREEVTKEAPDAKKSTGSFKLESTLIGFLCDNKDIFAWKPLDMPSIPREVAKHTLKICLGSKPVRQRLHCFDEKKCRTIGEEIAKLSAAGFIKEV